MKAGQDFVTEVREQSGKTEFFVYSGIKFTQVLDLLLEKNIKFEYGVGSEVEYTQVDTYLYNSDEANQQRYFNLFPSVQDYIISMKLTHQNSLTAVE